MTCYPPPGASFDPAPFVERLAECELLIAARGHPTAGLGPRHQAWLEGATLLTARALGIPVAVAGSRLCAWTLAPIRHDLAAGRG